MGYSVSVGIASTQLMEISNSTEKKSHCEIADVILLSYNCDLKQYSQESFCLTVTAPVNVYYIMVLNPKAFELHNITINILSGRGVIFFNFSIIRESKVIYAMHHSCAYVEQIVCKCQQFSSPSLGNQKINQSTNRNHFYGVYKKLHDQKYCHEAVFSQTYSNLLYES